MSYELIELIPRQNISKIMYMARFPLNKGKIPGIEAVGLCLTETVAIVTVGAVLYDQSGCSMRDGEQHNQT